MSKFLPFQIENEYGYYESSYGDAGKRYALWAAKMALSQNTGVPWIMCQQWDVPAPVVRTLGLWKVETNSFCGWGMGFNGFMNPSFLHLLCGNILSNRSTNLLLP